MMLAYFTLTGQTRKFVNKFPEVESVEIQPANPFIEMEEPFILVVPTYEAEITEPVNDFLETGQNIALCRGIFGGGNRNFAQLFCFTADDLSEEYNIPVLHRFEFQGSENDVAKMEEELKQYAQ
ncbi:class Ib ribonucleoside-diphosphate reductase assembly flavoprotein NrdI [Suicoccus acidiformans]|uniref:Class Ib ribonucleoside-diphosphate reductase assembly flavoprotein NrdI n=1 Tax=Suicoccus acidiformans TaxID=2036206 RepID=A0A347WJI4_9LACT|nr:class Ib ribonucleoside-diphosphate reductase assembly flavoprotein NrdI [Suicoccus acidiformans]AXY25241.1 class Ib ribonucleoside-diphosphate reductase assembly flavoprotein NrdI [Suicoccus acidiformans]